MAQQMLVATQAAQAAASAAQKAAEAHLSSGRREENKLVEKPGKLVAGDFTEEQKLWPDWKEGFLGWLTAQDLAFEVELSKIDENRADRS